jgi:hypothetical protein
MFLIPAATKALAMLKPMPYDAPVIQAFLPSNEKMFAIIDLLFKKFILYCAL